MLLLLFGLPGCCCTDNHMHTVGEACSYALLLLCGLTASAVQGPLQIKACG